MLPECLPPDFDPEPSTSSSSETQESQWIQFRLCPQCLSGPEVFFRIIFAKYIESDRPVAQPRAG